MRKPAPPPREHYGSARKPATSAGWGALCAAAAGFRFGGGDCGVAAETGSPLARRFASIRLSGSASAGALDHVECAVAIGNDVMFRNPIGLAALI